MSSRSYGIRRIRDGQYGSQVQGSVALAERDKLEAIVRQQPVAVAQHRRTRILLLADKNHRERRRTDVNIARLAHISERQVKRIRQRRYARQLFDSPYRSWLRVAGRARTRLGRGVRDLLGEEYLQAKSVTLALDNLNTYSVASLYHRFRPKQRDDCVVA